MQRSSRILFVLSGLGEWAGLRWQREREEAVSVSLSVYSLRLNTPQSSQISHLCGVVSSRTGDACWEENNLVQSSPVQSSAASAIVFNESCNWIECKLYSAWHDNAWVWTYQFATKSKNFYQDYFLLFLTKNIIANFKEGWYEIAGIIPGYTIYTPGIVAMPDFTSFDITTIKFKFNVFWIDKQ